MTIRKTDEDAYFAASNSAEGFFSYYPQCFDASRIRHVYAVKGGPGTGKSRFLRDVAQAGESLGWQCEYIYCSSDPDSLDGVILTGEETCIALVDATAPHMLIDAMKKGDLVAALPQFENMFEHVIEPLRPAVGECKRLLTLHGAAKSMMSGSGPAVWGIFEREADAARAVEALTKKGYRAYLCRMLDPNK